MAGSKKNKLKKTLHIQPVAPSHAIDKEDDGLMNDLLEQLDSRAPDASSESTADNEVQIAQQADHTEANGKQGAKGRFKARQVRYILCRPQIPLKYYLAGPEGCCSCPDLST